MSDVSFALDPEVADYVRTHATPLGAPCEELIDLTQALSQASMQVSAVQARFLAWLVELSRARRVLEIGTFTGLSALCMARALPEEGRLLACDVSVEWTDIARRYWERAGVADRIDLRIGPALETVRSLPDDETFDLVFIDADKGSYPAYLEAVVPHLRIGGLLLADNVLRGGRIIDADAGGDTAAMRRFNDAVLADPRLESLVLPAFDGLTMAVKRRH